MKKLILLISILCVVNPSANSQTMVKHAPPMFDSVRANIAYGKIDTVVYESETVGAKRKAVIYTPP